MDKKNLPIFNSSFLNKLKNTNKVPGHFKFLLDDQLKYECVHLYHERCKQYINSAIEIGLFNSSEGSDLKRRLQSKDKHQFFSALAHCKASFFFNNLCKLETLPTPPSTRGKHNLDLKIKYNAVNYLVEVKTPIRLIDWDSVPEINGMKTVSWWGSDSDKLKKGVREACKQFDSNNSNILFLDTSYLRAPIDKIICEEAFIGHHVVTFKHNIETGVVIDQGSGIRSDGIFVNALDANGKFIKKDRSIPFTRISACICFQEHISGFISSINTDVFVIHNPYAEIPIPRDLFLNYPRLVKTESHRDSFIMEWI